MELDRYVPPFYVRIAIYLLGLIYINMLESTPILVVTLLLFLIYHVILILFCFFQELVSITYVLAAIIMYSFY